MSLARMNQMLQDGESLVFATFGDSITFPCYHTDFRQNYMTFTVDALRAAYPNSNVRIIHAGNMGTAGRGLAEARFERYVLAHKPHAVFIMYAMNDCGGGPGGLGDFDRNLTTLIRKTREAGALPIVLNQNVIISHPSAGRSALPLYQTRVLEVAAREQTPGVDCNALWRPLEADPEGLAARLNDYIHPNLAGHRLFTKAILGTLWPEATRFLPDAATTPPRSEEAEAVPSLLPGPPHKQVVRTAGSTWFALSARRRAGRFTDPVLSFADGGPEVAWKDFRHVTLIGPPAAAVFDYQDRELNRGILLLREGFLCPVFSWNIGVSFLRLDLNRADWAERVTNPTAWLAHTDQPFLRPTIIHSSNTGEGYLHDGYLDEEGRPAVLCSHLQMRPGAGWEVVEGEKGIAHVQWRPGPDRTVLEFPFSGEPACGQGSLRPDGAASRGVLTETEGRLAFSVRGL